MKDYTKLVDGYWRTTSSKTNLTKEDWVEIFRDSEGNITSPQGLVDQIINDSIKNSLNDINTNYEKEVAKLTYGVPKSELLTWTKQEQEARSWAVDNTVSTPLLDEILAKRSTKFPTKQELVTKVITKADLYSQAIGALTGLRQAQEDALGL